MGIKVAFIDDAVNKRYLMTLNSNKVKFEASYEKTGHQMVEGGIIDSGFSHSTVCLQVFYQHVSSECELYVLHILDKSTKQAKPKDLVLALQWCMENEIKLINLSLGTTQLSDMAELYEMVDKLAKKNVIIVAANSNQGNMSFPAVFPQVIGVKKCKLKQVEEGFIVQNRTLDFIDVICGMEEKEIEFEGYRDTVYRSNSYITPIITAKVCNYINSGIEDLQLIRQQLYIDSLKGMDEEVFQMEIGTYSHNQIDVPVIAILYNEHTKEEAVRERFVKKLIQLFKENGYYGICLSDEWDTKWVDSCFDLRSFSNQYYDSRKMINYFCSYIEMDYIILDVEESKMGDYSCKGDIDILLNSHELGNIDEKSQYILEMLK